ncbi:MAG TPA: UDP-N-acetylmuramate--L-alanine ligase [Longimicrobiaceae bacterium]|nr:UDP-N-acetylmuramate--L-alanine ligase [Longimicrobiaceae bacterium]
MTTLDLIALARHKPIHFMGIGGAGMYPLAELVRRSGGQVSGCDSQLGAAVQELRKEGVDVEAGHDPSHVEGCSALVITAAVPADHPEVQAARAAGIPVVKRAQALGGIVNRGTVVGIAGTHGKTTTTALTTAVLDAAGMNPTGLVGGRVPAWGGNLRLGGDRLFVVEADEYDRSFLTLHPEIAVVTTLEADHLDIYGSLAGVEEAFLTFVASVPDSGLVAACADDPGVARLLAARPAGTAPVVTYGSSAGSMLRAEDLVTSGMTTRFAVRDSGKSLGHAELCVPGLHNVRNALAAIAVGVHLGAKWSDIVQGLATYSGVERRFERVGESAGVLVVDDYAHHPTEIAATLSAARAAHPGRRLVAVFQPHLYSRTRDFADEFGRTLAVADIVFVADVYPAREKAIPGVTGEMVANAAQMAGANVRYIADRDRVVESVTAALRPGDLCLTLGAGDLNAAAREILSALQATVVQ